MTEQNNGSAEVADPNRYAYFLIELEVIYNDEVACDILL